MPANTGSSRFYLREQFKIGDRPCSTRSFSSSASAFSLLLFFTSSHATVCEERAMIFDYGLGILVTIGLLAYLVYALIRPERF
jgi:K+-transporting ATPase KdpF subunit